MENENTAAALEIAAQKRRRQILVVAVITLVAFAIGFITGLGVARKINPCVVVPTISVERDTTTKTDTVQGKIVPPVIRWRIRRDTLVLPSKTDTLYRQADTTTHEAIAAPQAYVLPDGKVVVPIEQKVYATGLYRAVVSGWHAALDSITVYPKTTTVRETITKLAQPPRRNWAVTVGPSATYTTGKQFVPGVSATLGFVVGSWH
jgi:hypothetical protein